MRRSSFVAIARNREALHGTDVDAGVALDAAAASNTVSISQFRQRCTSRAVCSALKPSSTSMFNLLEALDQIDVLHLLARRRIVVVVIAPLADAHFLADQVHALCGPLGDGTRLAMVVRSRSRPDDRARRPR